MTKKVIFLNENLGAIVLIDKLEEYKLSTLEDHDDSNNKKKAGAPIPIPTMTKIRSDCWLIMAGILVKISTMGKATNNASLSMPLSYTHSISTLPITI
jgi:hypothetical protein